MLGKEKEGVSVREGEPPSQEDWTIALIECYVYGGTKVFDLQETQLNIFKPRKGDSVRSAYVKHVERQRQ